MLRTDLKDLERQEIKAIGIWRSRETHTKVFDQAVSKFGSTVFENNRRDSIQTVSLPKTKAREGLENVIIENDILGMK